MTRENKLALVVGFGLLLFVGILVSDHFSAAHRQDKADLTVARESRPAVTRPITIAPVVAAVATTATENRPEPMAAVGGDVVPASRGVVPIPSAGAERSVAVVESPVLDNRHAAGAPKAGTSRQESEPGVKLRPIAEGESLYSICKQEYGDGSLSEALAKYNKSAVPDPRRIRKGVTIRIPPVETLRGGRSPRASAEVARTDVPALAATEVVAVESADVRPGTRTIDVIESPAPVPAKVAAGDRTYVVRKGDTLSSIAQRELGSKARWKDIVTANGSSLRDPGALSPGMKIRIPAKS
jgi:nucleoid-associated protein YgaU